MENNKPKLKTDRFSRESLIDESFDLLFQEIATCGMRDWEKKHGKERPIFKHPTDPSYSRLDFTHLYDFLIEQTKKKGLPKKKFENAVNDSEIQWEAFYLGRYRNLKPDKVEGGICTAARFLKIDLICLLAQFLKECEAKKIRLVSHQEFEETISKFLLEAERVGLQQGSSFEAQRLQQKIQSQPVIEQFGTINALTLVLGKEKWLDPYNLSEIRFIGRGKELEQLDRFASHEHEQQKLRIWAVEGSSGAGKTRLTIEWINRSKTGVLKGWDLRILHKQDRSDLAYWSSWTPDKPTLIVIDYMFGFEQVISNISLGRVCRHPNRA